MSKFDFYEIVGYIAPGALLLFTLNLLSMDLPPVLQNNNITVGDFGIYIIISYILGHLIQSAGNIFEEIYWKFWGGKPSDWIRTNKHLLISTGQRAKLEELLKEDLAKEGVASIKELSEYSWKILFSSINIRIKPNNKDSRSYIFTSNYGLMRGVTIALIISLIIVFFSTVVSCYAIVLLVCGITLSIIRMHRFGCYYVKEVLITYINKPLATQKID